MALTIMVDVTRIGSALVIVVDDGYDDYVLAVDAVVRATSSIRTAVSTQECISSLLTVIDKLHKFTELSFFVSPLSFVSVVGSL